MSDNDNKEERYNLKIIYRIILVISIIFGALFLYYSLVLYFAIIYKANLLLSLLYFVGCIICVIIDLVLIVIIAKKLRGMNK